MVQWLRFLPQFLVGELRSYMPRRVPKIKKKKKELKGKEESTLVGNASNLPPIFSATLITNLNSDQRKNAKWN